MSIPSMRRSSALFAGAIVSSLLASGCVQKPANSAAAGGMAHGRGAKLDTETSIPPPGDRLTPVARHGQLRVQGAQLLDESGKPTVLRGQAFGWDNWWPQYYNASVVRWLWDDWCADVVRLAMGIEPDGAYLKTPGASKARIEAAVEGAIQSGIYVIIDWHAHHLHPAEAIAFFSEMAAKYGDRPNVIYELFNEPENDATWPQVKEYATAVIQAIREHDPDNIIIVGSPQWDQRIDAVASDPLQGQTNVMYSVHFYADSHRDWLRQRTLAAVRKGIPVFVSESGGSNAAGQGQNNYTEWKAWIDFLETNHISWLNWSVSDKAGETCSVLQPGANPSGNWTVTELTDTGKHVRNLLRSYCGK
jgi:endoglucanase